MKAASLCTTPYLPLFSLFLPLMIPISPQLCLFLIFSLLSLILSPFIFLLPPLLSFFSLSPLFLSSLFSFILCSVGSIALFHAFAYHLSFFLFSPNSLLPHLPFNVKYPFFMPYYLPASTLSLYLPLHLSLFQSAFFSIAH